MDNKLTVQESQTDFIEAPREEYALLERARWRAERNNLLMKEAQVWAASDIVPAAYQKKPSDCFIAVDMADRMGLSALFIMQVMHTIKGKPAWSGQACIALINNCGKFDDLRFVFTGNKGSDSYGCYATAKRRGTGEEVTGTEITMGMAKGEGWTSNKKWQTMTDQMLQYRAAAFFARIHCPEALMGLTTVEESEDIEPRKKRATGITEALRAEAIEAPKKTEQEPAQTTLDAPIE